MVPILSIAPLALAAVSAVSGHVIRHRAVPQGWDTNVLQVCSLVYAESFFSVPLAELRRISHPVLTVGLPGSA
jgi:hypothetical protein